MTYATSREVHRQESESETHNLLGDYRIQRHVTHRGCGSGEAILGM
jgi:hypothetical protein